MIPLDWFRPKKNILHIEEHELAAFQSAISKRFLELERRIAKQEGEYGVVIRDLKADLNELEAENEELHGIVAQAQDIEVQRKKLMEVAPQAADQLGLSTEQKTQLMAALANPMMKSQIDAMLQQYFPDTPVTLEGLLTLAPVLFGAFKGNGKEKKQTNNDLL